MACCLTGQHGAGSPIAATSICEWRRSQLRCPSPATPGRPAARSRRLGLRCVATTSGYAYYVLGVPGGAPMHVVRRAYTDLLLQAHPETAQDGGSLARLMEIQDAYETIVEYRATVATQSMYRRPATRPPAISQQERRIGPTQCELALIHLLMVGMLWAVGWLVIKVTPWFVALVAALAARLGVWSSLNIGIAAAVVAVTIFAPR